MSSGDPRRAERGFTFVEVAVTVAIVALVTLLFERAMGSTSEADRLLKATRLVTERGQRTAFDLRDVVGASRRLLGADGAGPDYLAALDLSRVAMLPGARLPVFDETRPLGPDAVGDPRTGNVLLLVREAGAREVVVDAGTGARRRIDTYRFVCVYPGVPGRTLLPGGPPAVDLVHWRSVAYPALGQILAIADAAQRRAAVQALVSDHGFEVAWDATAAPDDAFRELRPDGSVGATPVVDPEIPEDPDVSPGGLLVHAGVQCAATSLASVPRRPVFAVDPPETWAPHGFEVKVAGASGARRVWLHLALEGVVGASVAVETHTVVASTRDL